MTPNPDFRLSSSDPPRLVDHPVAAWSTSAATHAAIFLALAFLVHPTPRGVQDEPDRSAGIVLKATEIDKPIYQDEALAEEAVGESEAISPEPENRQDLQEALPDVSPDEALASHLPPPLGLTLATSDKDGEGDKPRTGRPGGGLPSGKGATVRVFDVAGTGSKFVYAFDRSVSMQGAPLAAAKEQLVASLDSLGSTHQFQILFFNHRVRGFDITGGQRRIAFATEQNKSAADRFVSNVTADGGTDRYAALRRAIAMGPDVVFFLTDADDAMTSVELGQIAALNRRIGATVCSIEFGRGPAHGKENFLMQIALMTGGEYGYVDTTRLTAPSPKETDR